MFPKLGGVSCSPPELITTEADSVVDPDSDYELERKDSLDVHEEGLFTFTIILKLLYAFNCLFYIQII